MASATERLRYRLLTGPDDAEFSRRVSLALDEGYELHGSPAITYDGSQAILAQAVVLPPYAAASFRPSAISADPVPDPLDPPRLIDSPVETTAELPPTPPIDATAEFPPTRTTESSAEFRPARTTESNAEFRPARPVESPVETTAELPVIEPAQAPPPTPRRPQPRPSAPADTLPPRHAADDSQ
jgi:hypothetical protein